jgi:hypothetical protein
MTLNDVIIIANSNRRANEILTAMMFCNAKFKTLWIKYHVCGNNLRRLLLALLWRVVEANILRREYSQYILTYFIFRRQSPSKGLFKYTLNL